MALGQLQLSVLSQLKLRLQMCFFLWLREVQIIKINLNYEEDMNVVHTAHPSSQSSDCQRSHHCLIKSADELLPKFEENVFTK